jgi:hypothetical protein
MNHGFLPFNIGWYRKHFELPAGLAMGRRGIKCPPPSARAQAQLQLYISLSACPWRCALNDSTAYGQASAGGKSVYLDFDGVYRAADFWLNGVWIGHHESGYAPFRWYIHNVTGAALNTGPRLGLGRIVASHYS